MKVVLEPLDSKIKARLLKIKGAKDLEIKSNLPFLRSSFTGLDMKVRPLELRPYQVNGVYHLLEMDRFVLGDDCGLGKTLQSIVAMCHLWEDAPQTKLIVLTIKSSVTEWIAEFKKFTEGISVFEVPSPVALQPKKMKALSQDEKDFFDEMFCHDPANGKDFWTKKTYTKLCHLWTRSGLEGDDVAQGIACEVARALTSETPLSEEQKTVTGELFRKYRLIRTSAQERRGDTYRIFAESKGPSVLLLNYQKAVSDYGFMQDLEGFVLITDEATAYKNHKTNAHSICKALSEKSSRTWALTATMVENNLVDAFGIYRVVVPGLFPSKNNFHENYCTTKLQSVGRRRKIPIVTGHTKAHIEAFKERIYDYYLGRAKHEVSDDLPSVISKVIEVKMTSKQDHMYKETLSGLLSLGGEVRETTKLTQIGYCQQIVNHPELMGTKGPSPKIEALIDIMTTGDLAGEKFVVFTRFSKMVDIGVRELEKKGIKCVRITGKESKAKRAGAMRSFRNPKGKARVAWITTAGSQAINLQSGKAIVYFDTPFTAGGYLQSRGRIDRIGSPHEVIFAIHLVAKGTIDEWVMKGHYESMELFEAALGSRTKKATNADIELGGGTGVSSLFEVLMADARKYKKSKR